MFINNPTKQQRISYYQTILNLYLINSINGVVWDDKQEKFLFQIPNETDAEDALKTKLLTQTILSLDSPADYLQAFSYLHTQGIEPLEGSKAYSLAKFHLYGTIYAYRFAADNHQVQIAIKDQTYSISLATAKAKFPLLLQNGGVINWNGQKITLSIAEVNDVLSQLTTFIQQIEKDIVTLIQGIEGLWNDIVGVINKLF